MHPGRSLLLLTLVVCLPAALLAQEGVSKGAQQRSEPQTPGLPPPYYFYPNGAPTTSHIELSPEDAIAGALATASTWAQSRVDESVAAEDLGIARSSFYPAIGIPLAYTGNTPSPADEPGMPAVPSFAPANGINEVSAMLSATGTIDIAGQLRASLRRSSALLAAAHAGSEEARRSLVIATIDAYFGLSLARQKRRLGDETLALAEAFTRITAELVEEGKSEATDLSRARAEALRRRDELEQARVAESAASDLLHAIAGIDPAVHVGVVRPGSDVPPLGELANGPGSFVDSRPQLRQIDAQQSAAVADAGAAHAARLPQLAYSLSAGFDATDVHDLHRFTGAGAFVGVTIPVYDFGLTRARETEAALREQSLALQREILSRQLQQEFYTVRASALAALERIRISRSRAIDAEANLRELMAKYRAHGATITELIDAQSAHADARTALYQAFTDYETARARLAIDPASLSFEPAPIPDSEPRATCSNVTPPRIAGLSLGMTLDELRAAYPSLLVPAPDERGIVTIEASGSALGADHADDPAFAVTHATIRLSARRVTALRVVFSPDTVWETKDAFVAALAGRYRLGGPWQAFYDWSDRTLESDEDLRELALECAGFRVRAGLGYFSEGVRRVVTPHVWIEETAVRK